MTIVDAIAKAIDTCTCRRCRGLLVWEPCAFNYGRNYHQGSWRCVACGDWVDTEVLKNRSTLTNASPTPLIPIPAVAR